MKILIHTVAAATSVLFAGCASGPDRGAMDAEGKRIAISCCSDIRHLPPSQAFTSRIAVGFVPAMPHFDFGSGLSPFVRLTLPPASAGSIVAAYANTPGTGVLLGGEYTIRYVEPQVLFLTEGGEVLPSPEDTGLSVRVFEGRSALGRVVLVPEGAKSVVVFTASASAGKEKFTVSTSLPGTYIIGGVPITTSAIQHKLQYTAHTYGPAVIAVGSTTPTKNGL